MKYDVLGNQISDLPIDCSAFPHTPMNMAGQCASHEWGISMRDYFAARAMPVLLAAVTEFPDENWPVGVATDAYRMADAMMLVARR